MRSLHANPKLHAYYIDYLIHFDFAATVLVKLIHELRKLHLIHVNPHLQQKARTPRAQEIQRR
jgi:hypothetical protein